MHSMIWLALLGGCVDVPVTHDTPPSEPSSGTTGDTAEPSRTETGNTAGSTKDPCGVPGLELGTGVETHTALGKGDAVVLVHGPQNGWHVDLSVEARLTSSLMGFAASVSVVDSGVQIAGDQPEAYVSLDRVDDCVARTAGLRILVDDVVQPKHGYQAFICRLEGAELDVELVGTDLGTYEVFSASQRVVAALDPVDSATNCP